ncbi:MAG: sigma-70 family RNA polymerase sigma factor [Acidobacteriota bacterium]
MQVESETKAMMAAQTEARTQFSTAEIETLKRFAAGDLSAFEMLFRQHQAQVYGWIVRVVRDTGAAEDLTIETFWRIYRARERFDPERSFGAWARRIATNVAIDHLKTVPQEVSYSAEAVRAVEVDSDLQQHICWQTERAFRQLPAKLQAVAKLALVDERPYEEISESLGISVGAVKSRVFRAVRLLRKKLKQSGIEP